MKMATSLALVQRMEGIHQAGPLYATSWAQRNEEGRKQRKPSDKYSYYPFLSASIYNPLCRRHPFKPPPEMAAVPGPAKAAGAAVPPGAPRGTAGRAVGAPKGVLGLGYHKASRPSAARGRFFQFLIIPPEGLSVGTAPGISPCPLEPLFPVFPSPHQCTATNFFPPAGYHTLTLQFEKMGVYSQVLYPAWVYTSGLIRFPGVLSST